MKTPLDPKIQKKSAKKTKPAWIHPLQGGAGPRYQQIVTQMFTAIDEGLLHPGDRLPAQRDLANMLGVDLTTVTRAYAEARHRGLLEAAGGSGTYITMASWETTSIDLSMNIPPAPKGTPIVAMLQQAIAQVLNSTNMDVLMSYQVGGGTKAARAAAAVWLEPILGSVDPQQIVVCAGAQAAIAGVLLAQTKPGDTILAEPLTYPGLIAAAQQLGRRIVSVETDHEGMRPDALDRASKQHGASIVYLNPTIQNPTAITMPLQRRKDIAKVASKNNLTIIEDDPYWLLAGDAPAPIATLSGKAPTYYISTLSKCLTPGLRTAFVVIPKDQPVETILNALRAITLMPAPLMTAVATNWIQSGKAVDLLASLREEMIFRQSLAKAILTTPTQAHPSGLHQWLPLPKHWDQHRLVRAAHQGGLGVTPSDAFSVLGDGPDAVRISLGGAGDRDRLAQALRTLASILTENSAPAMSSFV